MHSPLFYACEIRFLQAPVSIAAIAWGCPTTEFLLRVSFTRPRLLIRFPFPIVKRFIDDANSRGEFISYLDVDSVLI